MALLPLLLLIPLWFLLVRPQQQRVRAQQALVRSLDVGDDILTSSGIYGTIVGLDDEVATLEVAEGVRLRIARAAIGRKFTTADEPAGGAVPPPLGAAGSELPPPPPPSEEQ